MSSIHLSTGAQTLAPSTTRPALTVVSTGGGGTLQLTNQSGSAFYADANGNVGIGTGVPMSKLEVNGDIRHQGMYGLTGSVLTNAIAPGSGKVGEIRFNSDYQTNRSNGVNYTGNGISLTPGIWSITVRATVANIVPTHISIWISPSIGGGISYSNITGFITRAFIMDAGNVNHGLFVVSPDNLFNVSTTTTYYPIVNIFSPSSSGFSIEFLIQATRIA